jgi:4,5-dihydroxyphthalate decarboxylase
VKLRYSVMDSPLTEPLQTGRVRLSGVELEVFRPRTTDSNSREMLRMAYDVAEMSFAAFVKAVALGVPLVALPVFTSGRRFGHPGMLLARDSGIRSLDEVAGRRIGLPQYWISSCVWQRLVLSETHGIKDRDVTWVAAETERLEQMVDPPGVQIRRAAGRSVAELLAEGAVEACFLPGGQDLPEDVEALTRPAYPDCVDAERLYYQRGGILPIMHVTVIRQDLAEEAPSVVASLLDGYDRAKRIAGEDRAARWPLPPAGHQADELRQLVGGDPWAYGITANRRPLEAFVNAAAEQGLVATPPELASLFVADLPDHYR